MLKQHWVIAIESTSFMLFQCCFLVIETTLVVKICQLNFPFQPNSNVETMLGHQLSINVILSMLFQRCFANLETMSINICKLNFLFQPNIHVYVFTGDVLEKITGTFFVINTPDTIASGFRGYKLHLTI